MSGHGKKWAIAAVVVVALVALVLRPGRHDSGTASSEPPRSAATATAPVTQGPPVKPMRLPGGVYALHYAFTMASPVLMKGQPGTISVKLDGRLETAPSEATPTETVFAARMVEPRLDVNQTARLIGDLGDSKAASLLALPFGVATEASGRVTDTHFARETTYGVRSLLNSVAYAAQYVPADGEVAEWDVDEEDANGGYHAHYASTSTGVRKTWRLGGDNADKEPALGELRGTGTVDFRLANGAVTGVTYRQQGEAAVLSAAPQRRATFDTTITLEWQGEGEAPWARGLKVSELPTFASLMPTDRNVPDAPTRPLAAILEAVANVPEKQHVNEHNVLRDELTGAIAHDPAALAEVDRLLRAGRSSPEAERTLIEGLVGARTAEAQHKLSNLLTDKSVERRLQGRLLQATALNTNPNDELIGALEAIAYGKERAYAADAAVTLGACAMQLARYDAAKAADVSHQLLKGATGVIATPQKPKDPISAGTRIRWLAALGNTGDPAVKDTILAGLKDSNELVRAAAADALRFQEPLDVRERMEQVMATDDSIHVRRALIDAARIMGPGPMQPFVQKALFSDKSEYVRLGAAYTIAVWSATAPGLRVVLSDALRAEKSETVRESLRQYIQPNRLEPPWTSRPLEGATP